MQEFFKALLKGIQDNPVAILVALIFAFSASLAVLFSAIHRAIVRAWKNRLNKRKQKQQQKRTVQFALPDKDNSFVRERLQFVLNAKDEEINKGDSSKARTFFEFLYAQKLLAKLSEKQLSTAERLELIEMNKFLGAHLQQKSWNDEDIRAVNDCFARLLKLSAKYAVELPA